MAAKINVKSIALFLLFTAACAFNDAHDDANKFRAKYSLPVYLELLGDHPFTATLMDDMGTSYQALGDYESAIKFLRDALRMRKRSLGDHQETARSFHGLGKVQCTNCITQIGYKFVTFLNKFMMLTREVTCILFDFFLCGGGV